MSVLIFRIAFFWLGVIRSGETLGRNSGYGVWFSHYLIRRWLFSSKIIGVSVYKNFVERMVEYNTEQEGLTQTLKSLFVVPDIRRMFRRSIFGSCDRDLESCEGWQIAFHFYWFIVDVVLCCILSFSVIHN